MVCYVGIENMLPDYGNLGHERLFA